MKKIKFAVIGCGNIGSRPIASIKREKLAKLVVICVIDKSHTQRKT